MGGRLVCEELGGGVVAAVEVEPLGEATAVVWMLALLFRLEPKPKLLKRELMTSTMARESKTGLGRKKGSNGRCVGSRLVRIVAEEGGVRDEGAGAKSETRSLSDWRSLSRGSVLRRGELKLKDGRRSGRTLVHRSEFVDHEGGVFVSVKARSLHSTTRRKTRRVRWNEDGGGVVVSLVLGQIGSLGAKIEKAE